MKKVTKYINLQLLGTTIYKPALLLTNYDEKTLLSKVIMICKITDYTQASICMHETCPLHQSTISMYPIVTITLLL